MLRLAAGPHQGRTLRWERLGIAVAVAVAGLGPPGCDDGATGSMRAGEDCLQCHSATGEAAARPFSAAGTVYRISGSPAASVVVRLTDSASTEVSTVTDSVGNFG